MFMCNIVVSTFHIQYICFYPVQSLCSLIGKNVHGSIRTNIKQSDRHEDAQLRFRWRIELTSPKKALRLSCNAWINICACDIQLSTTYLFHCILLRVTAVFIMEENLWHKSKFFHGENKHSHRAEVSWLAEFLASCQVAEELNSSSEPWRDMRQEARSGPVTAKRSGPSGCSKSLTGAKYRWTNMSTHQGELWA